MASDIKAGAIPLSVAQVNDRAAELVIPKHIGIIMDGNRRWAEVRGLPRVRGHEAGADALEKAVKACAELGVEALTVYAFSTENWKSRTKMELKEIFALIKMVLKSRLRNMKKQGVMISLLGEINRFPLSVRKLLVHAKTVLKKNHRIKLNLALNYGGRDEVLRAFRRIMDKGISVKEINEELINEHLDTQGLPDPELIIRTGGRQRLSNFLVWQCTYSELYFTDKLWPDFDANELKKAILYYNQCDRNFGK